MDMKGLKRIVEKVANKKDRIFIIANELSDLESNLFFIDKYPLIFYKCSKKRVMLTKDVIEEAGVCFNKNTNRVVSLDVIYSHLRERFRVFSMNRANLATLFGQSDELYLDDYIEIKSEVLFLYDSIMNSNKQNLMFYDEQVDIIKYLKTILPKIDEDNMHQLKGYLKKHIEAMPCYYSEDAVVRICQAVNVLGSDLVLDVINNKAKSKYLLELTTNWINTYNEQIKALKIQEELKLINHNNKIARVFPLLSVFKIDEKCRGNLKEFFLNQKVIFVNDLEYVTFKGNDQYLFDIYLEFIRWLRNDLIYCIKMEFYRFFKSERDIRILNSRAKGLTLNKVGEQLDITRERVRQLEKKAIKKFTFYMSNTKVHHILHAKSVHDNLISTDIIHNCLKELAEIFIYCFKNTAYKDIVWCEELASFIVGDRSCYEELQKYANDMPESFHVSELDAILSDVNRKLNININIDVANTFLISKYKLVGDYCLKNTVSMPDKYTSVLEEYNPDGKKLLCHSELMRLKRFFKEYEEIEPLIIYILNNHFQNGFRLDSPIEMNRLRKFARNDYGKEFLSSDETLRDEIMKVGTYFDGKIYLVSEKSKESLKRLVFSALNSGNGMIFYKAFFDKNVNWLIDNNIVSEDMLKALLEELLPDGIFKKSYFAMNADVTIEGEIKRCFKQSSLLNYHHLNDMLPYIPIDIIKWSLSQIGDFIWNSVGVYTELSKFDITEEEKQEIVNIAALKCNENGYLSLAEIPINKISERNPELSVSAILNSVFSVCLDGKYKRRGKIVTLKGVKLNAIDITKKHCRSLERCTLDELLSFEKELTGEVHHWVSMEAAYAVMVRIDSANFVAQKYVEFDVAKIDDILDGLCPEDYLPLRSITTFAAFPHVGQVWTLFLLESYVRRFSEKYRFEVLSVNSKNCGAIVRNSCDKNYREIMTDAVAKSDVKLSKKEVLEFLYSSGYIGKRSLSSIDAILSQAKIIRERGR